MESIMTHDLRELVRSHNHGSLTHSEYLAQLRAWLTAPPDPDLLNVTSHNRDAFAWHLSETMKSPDWIPLTDAQAFQYLSIAQSCIDNVVASVREQLYDLVWWNPFPGAVQPIACLAAQRGNSTILKLCLDQGIVQFDRFLDEAAHIGLINLDMLNLLIDIDWHSIRSSSTAFQRLVDISTDKPAIVQAAFYAKGTICPIHMFAWQILRRESADKIKVMLNEGKARHSLKKSRALQYAARVGNVQVIKMLLHAGADINEIPPSSAGAFGDKNNNGPYTALHEAVAVQNVRLVRFLLRRGARPDAEDGVYHDGNDIMLCAESTGDPDILQMLRRALEKAARQRL